MKKMAAIISSLSLVFSASSAYAASGSNASDPKGMNNLFLVYTGYSLNGDGTSEEQHWDAKDFQPVLTHINRSSGRADGTLFTNFLFTASAIKNTYGQMEYISQGIRDHDKGISQWAYPMDWRVYMQQLFQGNNPTYYPQNVDALYDASIHNGLNHPVETHVWIALPYPDSKNFKTDTERITTLESWLDSFIQTWKSKGYAGNFQLKGFYWIGESVDRSALDDHRVMKAVNDYIHQKAVNQENYCTVWIPYEGASEWDQWRNLGFDQSFLQPNYYFDTNKSIQSGIKDAYASNQGVEMELDLGVTWDYQPGGYRSRFVSYLNYVANGGSPSTKPSLTSSNPGIANAWYTGGWWWGTDGRDQSILHLYHSGDKLYDSIHDFVQGNYQPNSAK